MADIFISYKREEKDAAFKLRSALEHFGYSVWFDVELLSGEEFRPVIIEMIDQCKAVIVLWSPLAAGSQFVIDEAGYAMRQDKLCPAMLEPCQLPFGFGGVHADDLSDWSGQARHEGFNRLLASLERKIGREAILGAEPPVTDSQKAEIADFQTVAKLRSAKAWKRFLSDYPSTSFRRFVEAQIAELDHDGSGSTPAESQKSKKSSRSWLLALPVLALIGVGAFVYSNQQPETKGEARLEETEYDAWKKAQANHGVGSYEAFLKAYPDGDYAHLAKKWRNAAKNEYFEAEAYPDGKPGPDTCVISLIIPFEFDRSSMMPEWHDKLQETVRLASECNIQTVQVTGHMVPTTSTQYDLSLSRKMAGSVKDNLVALGVDTNLIETEPYGNTQQVYGEGDPRNRRVEVEFIGTR